MSQQDCIVLVSKSDNYTCSKGHVSSNKITSEEHVAFLSIETKCNLAMDKKISARLEIQLAKDTSIEVRAALAANQGVTPSTQKKLAKDTSIEVRAALAANQGVTPSTQKKLVKDTSIEVRAALAANQSLSLEVQKKILLSSDRKMIEIFISRAENEETQTLILEEGDIDQRRELASNLYLSESVQGKLAVDQDGLVKNNLGRNPSLSPLVQHQFLTNGSWSGIMSLSHNPNLDRALIAELAKEGLPPVGVICNSSLRELFELKELIDYSKIPIDIAFIDRLCQLGPDLKVDEYPMALELVVASLKDAKSHRYDTYSLVLEIEKSYKGAAVFSDIWATVGA